MAAPQYNAREYKRAKEALRPIVAEGRAVCAEIICVMPSRHIPAGAPWALAHDHRDPSNTTLLGPAHRRCNLAENARRNNPKRSSKRRRWAL